MMGDIYSKSQGVLVWLGTPHLDFKNVSDLFQQGSFSEPRQQSSQTPSTSNGESSRIRLAFADYHDYRSLALDLLTLPWFDRAWVVQEAVLPAKVTFALGSFTFPIENLWRFISTFGIRQSTGYLVLNEIMRLRSKRFRPEKSNGKEAICFYHTLSILTPRCKTSIPHDIIFAFLGLQDSSKVQILPDYNMDWNKVPELVTKSIIKASNSLDLLGVLHRRGDDTTRWFDLPSWVPDWSRRLEAEPMVFPRSWMYFNSASSRIHKGTSAHGIQSTHLVATGKIVNEVMHKIAFTQDVGKYGASRRYWNVCSTLNLLHQYNQMALLWSKARRQPSEDRLLKTLLADGSFTLSQALRTQCSDGLSTSYITELLETYHLLERFSKKQWRHMPSTKTDVGRRAAQLCDHARVAWGRRLIVSSDWRLGLVHESACEGDVICIIHGSKVPLVLRRLQSGHYRLIGQCYFESAMRGEEVTWGEDDADEFILE